METPLNADRIEKEYEKFFLELGTMRFLDVTVASSAKQSNKQQAQMERRKPIRHRTFSENSMQQEQMLMQKDYYQYDGLILFNQIKYAGASFAELKSAVVSSIIPFDQSIFDLSHGSHLAKLIEKLRRMYECLCMHDDEFKKPFENVNLFESLTQGIILDALKNRSSYASTVS
jgi:hypothetical protein